MSLPVTNGERKALKVGTRVTVYWPDDDAWYKGTVASVFAEDDQAVMIEYDDGEMAWMDLGTAKWRAATKSEDWLKFDNLNMLNKKKQVAKFQVGLRLSLWWPADKLYCTGTLSEICRKELASSHEANSSATPHFIRYDDGDEEWVNLIHRKFKRVEAKAERLRVGSRVSIRHDRCNNHCRRHYRATITKIVRTSNKPHRVKYDAEYEGLGGTKEWLNLNVHPFLDIEESRCDPHVKTANTLVKRKFQFLSTSQGDEELISPQAKKRLKEEANAKQEKCESQREHVCIVCRGVAKRVVAAPCHHIICKRCVRFNSNEGDDRLLCPLCSKEVPLDRLVKYRKDHISFRSVEALDICTAEVVHRFVSPSSASLELHVRVVPSQIIDACRSKRRDDRMYRGYLWRFAGSRDRILRAGEAINEGIPIEQVDLDSGDVIETFSSSRKACEKTKVSRCSIRRVLDRRGKADAGGFFWRFQGETHKPWPDPGPTNLNPVQQLDFETGDFLAEYISLAEAKRAMGMKPNSSCIRDVCMGKGRGTAQGFFWRWKGSKRLPDHMMGVQKVVQIRKTPKGQVIKEFRTSREAQSYFGHQCCWSTFCRYCREKKYANGFYWQYRMLREKKSPEEEVVGKRLRVKRNGEWLDGVIAGLSSDTRLHEVQFDSGTVQHVRLSALEYEWKNDQGQKPIEQLDIKTGKVVATFDSISDAASALGPSASATRIVAVVKGRYHSSAGFFWRYKGSNAQPTMPKGKRKVEQICLETGVVIGTFESIASAGKSVGIATPGISYCCNGRNQSKSAGGYGWRFAENRD